MDTHGYDFILSSLEAVNIGGLSCAYALASAGHNVRLLERLQKDDPTSWSGIRVPPNLSKILTEWGLGEELKEKTLPCYRAMFDDLETGDGIGCIEWKEEVIQESGGDFLLMHHRDLYNMLYRLAVDAGVEIMHGVDVVNIIPGQDQAEKSFASEPALAHSIAMPVSTVDSMDSPEFSPTSFVSYGPPCVVLANRDVLYADIIVGTDGANSLVRNVVLSPKDDRGRRPGMNILSNKWNQMKTFDS